MTGEPLAPVWEATAAAQADGLISPEHVKVIATFHKKLPGWVDVGTPPTHCSNGHDLGPRRCLVGFAHCNHRGGHTTWWCRECGVTMYGPPLTEGCSLLVGPAAVRLSNR